MGDWVHKCAMSGSAPFLLQEANNLSWLCVSFGLVLGVDELVVGDHFKSASTPLDQGDFCLWKSLLDFILQPGGVRQVVSHHAIFDGYFHRVRWIHDTVLSVRLVRFAGIFLPVLGMRVS